MLYKITFSDLILSNHERENFQPGKFFSPNIQFREGKMGGGFCKEDKLGWIYTV